MKRRRLRHPPPAAVARTTVPRAARWVGLAAIAVLGGYLISLVALGLFNFSRFAAVVSTGLVSLVLIGLLGVVFASVLIAGRQVPYHVRQLGETLGIEFAPAAWVPTSYRSRYRTLTVTWVVVSEAPDRLMVDHPRMLHLGLLCGFGESPRDRDLFGRRLALDDPELTCLAADEAKATALFRDDPRVRTAVAALKQTGYSFRVDDQRVDLCTDDLPPSTVVDAACELSLALAASAFLNDEPPPLPLRRQLWFRIYFVVVAVLVLLALWAAVFGLGLELWGF
jgi:hypothetical protein